MDGRLAHVPGVDFAAPLGTPEYAVMDGVVLKAGPASGFGQAVYIQHANGDVTVYGHMEKILVTTGQVVQRERRSAAEVAEGGEQGGPHLLGKRLDRDLTQP